MNTYFVLSQAGLLMAAISGLAIIQLTSVLPDKRPWPYYVAVWIVSALCVFQFSSDATQGMSYEDAERVWKLRLGIGLERLVVFLSYRFAFAATLSGKVVARINRYVALSSLMLIAGMLAFDYYTGEPQPGVVERKLNKIELEVYKSRQVVAADTARTVELQKTVDKLTHQIRQDSLDKIALNRRVAELNRQVSGLTDLLIELKRAVRAVGVNVERSRKSQIHGAVPLRPIGPNTELIPTEKVRPVELPKGRRGRKFGLTRDWIDSLDIARYEYE